MLRSYLRAPWRFKLTVVRVTAWMAGVRVALWLLPYKVVQRALERDVAPVPDLPIEDVRLRRQRILSAVEATGKYLLGDKPCLTQALVAQRLLRDEGLDTDLRFGVSTDDAGFAAHAWLERGGRVVIGGSDSPMRYTPLSPVHP